MVHTDEIWNNVLEVITANTFFKANTFTGTLFIFETMLFLFILNCGENNEKQGRFMVRLICLIGHSDVIWNDVLEVWTVENILKARMLNVEFSLNLKRCFWCMNCWENNKNKDV